MIYSNPLSYRWGAGGTLALGVGIGAIAWSPIIPVADVDQVCGLVATSLAGANTVLVRLAFSDNGIGWYSEIVEALGALAGSVQRYTCNVKEWGPIAGVTSLPIHRPVDVHFMRWGVYAEPGVGAADFVTITTERQRTGQLQSSGS